MAPRSVHAPLGLVPWSSDSRINLHALGTLVRPHPAPQIRPRAVRQSYIPASSPAQIDGIHFIGHAAPAALLFQNARKDALNPEQAVLDFQHIASEPKTVKWYDAYHQLNAEADQDRAEWLQQQLDLKAVLPSGEGNFTG